MNYALKSRMLWLREWSRHTKKEFFRIGTLLTNIDHQITQDDIKTLQAAAQNLFHGHSKFRSLTIYSPDWTIIRRLTETPDNDNYPPTDEFKQKLIDSGELFIGSQYTTSENKLILPLGQTIMGRTGEPLAYLVAEMDTDKSLDRILGDTSDLDKSGTMYLISNGGSLLYHNDPYHSEPNSCSEASLADDLRKGPFWTLLKRRDCSGVPVLSVSAPIPEMDWVLVVQVDKMQALRELEKHMGIGSVTALAVLLIILIISWRSASRLADPLDELSRVARHISSGNHQERLPQFRDSYLNNVGEAFNSMLDTLEANKKSMIQSISLSAVGKLSSSIVHEMRNPLSSVKINLQALARKVKDDPAYSEMASIALTQVKRLESMFSDLLQFSKPIDLNPEEVSFPNLADEAREILTQKAADKIISLEIINNLGNRQIVADKKHLLLALINLIDNAIQWSPPESIVQIVGDPAPDQPDGFVITVRDQGPGINEEFIEKLFQPFYTTRDTGTGLGLANVKKIVEFHGGAVNAANILTGGAQFSMIFEKRQTP
ncbi:MAG: sensor histidine kinase [Pseudomonadota bacterium]